MAYEIYNKKMNKKDYFNSWTNENFEQLTEDLKEQIYQKYLVKCEVFKRDKFTCQNLKCEYCKNVHQPLDLTLHHIKWQKNEGENKARNGVTLCRGVHQAFHKAKKGIKFGDNKNLPTHIRGHTFKLEKSDRVNWRKVKKETKKLRKSLKEEYGIKLNWEQVGLLLRWLEIIWEEE